MKKIYFVTTLMLIASLLVPGCNAFLPQTVSEDCGDYTITLTIQGIEIKDTGCTEDGVSTVFYLPGDQITVTLSDDYSSITEAYDGADKRTVAECKLEGDFYSCTSNYSYTVKVESHPTPSLHRVSMNDTEVTVFFSYSGDDQLFLDHTDGGAIAIPKIYGQGVNLEQKYPLGELIYLEPGDEVKLCNHKGLCSEPQIVHKTEELVASGANELYSIEYPNEIPMDLRAPGFVLSNVIGARDGTILSQVAPWSLYWAYIPDIGTTNLQMVWFYYDEPAYYKNLRTDSVCYNGISYNSESTADGWKMWTTDCDPDNPQKVQSIVADCFNSYEITVSTYFDGFSLYNCLPGTAFFVENDNFSFTIVLNNELNDVLYVTHGVMPGVICDYGNCSFEHYSFRVGVKPLP